MANRMVRWLVWIGATLGGLALLFVLGVYILSERKLKTKYAAQPAAIPIPQTPETIARGEHMARAIGTCTLCHAEDLGGAVYADLGPLGIVAGPNLTRGRGGLGASFTDEDWVRAIRHGVRRDGTSLIVMPSEVFTYFSDSDLAALIAFLKQLPPVDREVPRSHFGPVGRGLLAAGKLNILVAPKTHEVTRTDITPAATPEYGRYLASVSGCHGCHGFGLSGGRVAGPENLPPASNITPAGIGAWTEDDFRKLMRTGVRPGGGQINEFMPWRTLGRMTDDELHALWLYLRQAPPRPFGQK